MYHIVVSFYFSIFFVELQFYLELEMIKDIHITNLEELGSSDYKWAITGTGFSTKHIYKVAKTLTKSLQELDVKKSDM